MACSMAFSAAGALVAQIDQRGEHILHRRSLHGRRHRRHGKVVQLVFQLHHEALGQLFAHAGNARQLRVILAADGLHRALATKARSAS